MELAGKKAAILVEELYNEFELWYPYYRLLEAGAQVDRVGSGSAQVYKSKIGLPAPADKDISQVSAGDYDGLIIPGGYSPDFMRRHEAMVDLVRQVFGQGKVVAAICHAGWMLASADIVKGKTVTSFFAIKDDLIHAGADWVDQEVVQDGKLITSRTPADLPAFMRAVIAAMK
ncbi:MAG: type 1 glutamine amidotransferase domain-containing protein [Desulfarculaceae bacterium]|jgi:protease I